MDFKLLKTWYIIEHSIGNCVGYRFECVFEYLFCELILRFKKASVFRKIFENVSLVHATFFSFKIFPIDNIQISIIKNLNKYTSKNVCMCVDYLKDLALNNL
jgi:hypothetical protein